MSPVIFWAAAIVFFALLEAATAGLVSMWFIGGSLAAFIAALLHASVAVQIILFLVVSGLLLALLRPIARKYIMPKHESTNADRLIGKQALVTQRVDNLHETGAIKINGVLWTAKSDDGSEIEAGTLVSILRIEGAKVYVKPAAVAAANE